MSGMLLTITILMLQCTSHYNSLLITMNVSLQCTSQYNARLTIMPLILQFWLSCVIMLYRSEAISFRHRYLMITSESDVTVSDVVSIKIRTCLIEGDGNVIKCHNRIIKLNRIE